MNLSKLTKKFKAEIIEIINNNSSRTCENNYNIKSIHSNSNQVKPGGLFVAIKGFKTDGHDYIEEAIQKGAKAIVSEKKIKDCKVPIIIVKNSRKLLSGISAFFFNNPSKHLFLIGITGTNGKTTVTYLIENILKNAGITGVIGTINIRYADNKFSNSITTPESYELQKTLSKMRKSGVTYVIMEVSSHAIDLFRIENCLFDIAVFTNLTQDHLDHHKDMVSYWECKKSLFTKHLIKGSKKYKATAVINTNNQYGKELYNNIITNKISVGIGDDNIISAKPLEFSVQGIKAILKTDKKEFKIESSLIGKHNLENILCAVGAGMTCGIDTKNIIKGIKNSKNIPGRLEKVENKAGKHIFIDYAHTPDALENVLLTLKEIGDKRLISVFGCGGERDKTKRYLMGKIAAFIESGFAL